MLHFRSSTGTVVTVKFNRNLSMFVINVPADGLAPNGARPSAGTVMATEFNNNLSIFLSLLGHQQVQWWRQNSITIFQFSFHYYWLNYSTPTFQSFYDYSRHGSPCYSYIISACLTPLPTIPGHLEVWVTPTMSTAYQAPQQIDLPPHIKDLSSY